MGNTWQTGRGSAIATFDTDKFRTITISVDAFARNPDLWTIDKTSPKLPAAA
jgi:hypothetical protein